jgi:hypothetical protein
MGMYYDIDMYLYTDGTRPYDAASGRYFTSSSLSSGVNFVYSFAGNTPVDRTTAAVNHNSNSTVPSWGSVFAEQFAENIDPRVFGFAQAAFGIFEMSVGIGTSWTGVGLLVTANGADDAWAGIATMYDGEHVHTLKYRALYAATGSETVATIGEIGAGLASGAAVSRLNHLAKLAKQAQQASNVGEAVVRTADNAVETLANSADNFAVSAASQSPVKRFELPTIQSWCFAPDTLVDTPQGKRRIDEIRENDLVFAFDFTSGQWVERPVEVCHRNLYQGSLIEISTKQGTVVATAYHPFWVLEGHDLANRPRPRKLADTEDEDLALRGRWVNSHDLMAGDLIYSTEGRELRVLKIVQRYAEQFEVCNLTIAQNHSFAVGNDGVLVHNTGGCGDAARVGGLGYPGSMPGMLNKAIKKGLSATQKAEVRHWMKQGAPARAAVRFVKGQQLRPGDFGAISIADDVTALRAWHRSIEQVLAHPQSIHLKNYLAAADYAGLQTSARKAFQSVKANFFEVANINERTMTIHHWNWTMNSHADAALNPRNLFVVSRQMHDVIHNMTTQGSMRFVPFSNYVGIDNKHILPLIRIQP